MNTRKTYKKKWDKPSIKKLRFNQTFSGSLVADSEVTFPAAGPLTGS